MSNGQHSKQLQTLSSVGVTRKVGAGVIAGSVLTLVIAILGQFEIELNAEIATAIGTLLTLVIQYGVRDRAREFISIEEVPDDSHQASIVAPADALVRDEGQDSWELKDGPPFSPIV